MAYRPELLVLCIRLLRRRTWTKEELAEELDVSTRTVQRYLKKIEDGGMDLEIYESPVDHGQRTYGIRSIN